MPFITLFAAQTQIDLTEFFSKVHIGLSGWPESVPNGNAPMGITGNNNL